MQGLVARTKSHYEKWKSNIRKYNDDVDVRDYFWILFKKGIHTFLDTYVF